jgi:hypothetical protein
VRLQREGLQPAVNRGLGDPSSSSQGSGTPVGAAVGELGLQRPVDHLGYRVVLISPWPAGPQLVMQPFDAQIEVELTPFAHRGASNSKVLVDSRVGLASSAGHHDLRPLNDRIRQGPRSSQALELAGLVS